MVAYQVKPYRNNSGVTIGYAVCDDTDTQRAYYSLTASRSEYEAELLAFKRCNEFNYAAAQGVKLHLRKGG